MRPLTIGDEPVLVSCAMVQPYKSPFIHPVRPVGVGWHQKQQAVLRRTNARSSVSSSGLIEVHHPTALPATVPSFDQSLAYASRVPRKRPSRRTAVLVGVSGVAACALAACSSSPSPSASSTTSTSRSGSATSQTTASVPTTTTTVPPVTTTTGTLVPETPTNTEFYAPSRNISCEIDVQSGTNPENEAFCLTLSPPQSATLTAPSALRSCAGTNCLANPGVGTPTLAYGVSVTVGTITCLSLTQGVTCTLPSGNGFSIAKAGITPLGSVMVTQTTSNG
jgi:hypothetical protein